MKLTMLGTSSMVPTKDRNVTSAFLEYEGDGILFDCGEGTQRQMNLAGINRLRINKILITHWHGDHVAGLIGLLQTVGNSENPGKIHIYGPVGTKDSIAHLMKAVRHTLKVDMDIQELNPEGVEVFHETEDYILECAPLNHTLPTVGYSFIEKDKIRIDMDKVKKLGFKQGKWLQKIQKGEAATINGKKINPEEVSYVQEGKKLTFIVDTLPVDNCAMLAKDSDLFVCEATFSDEFADKAKEYMHMTAKQAAGIAKDAGVKKLLLTHFSQRFKKVNNLVQEAKEVFPRTKAAADLMEMEI